MKTVLVKPVLAAVGLLLVLNACGTDTGPRATDPAGDPTDAPTASGMPTRIPAASGTVSTRTLATVMDTGRPELCLGAVAESYPPQCRGIPLKGWSWAELDGMFERSGDIRWGAFVVTGTFDGTALAVSGAIPGALYDPAPVPGPELCEDLPNADCIGPSPARLAAIQRELEDLPGIQTLWSSRFQVHADVVFDDGSLQAWADRTYGEGVVAITSALVPVGR
jgi:hypothetical protein